VDPIAEYNMPQYILREFKVTDARDGSSRTVRQFQFIDWPEQGVPKSGDGFIDFIGQVHKTKEQFGQDGPITVHCRYWTVAFSGSLVLPLVTVHDGRNFELDTRYVRFEVFTAVTMKNGVFWDVKTQFVLHRRHITSPLQSPAS
jgi:hypothetical protein